VNEKERGSTKLKEGGGGMVGERKKRKREDGSKKALKVEEKNKSDKSQQQPTSAHFSISVVFTGCLFSCPPSTHLSLSLQAFFSTLVLLFFRPEVSDRSQRCATRR
jgi:hypothetical protein